MYNNYLLAISQCPLFYNIDFDEVLIMLECFNSTICVYSDNQTIVAVGEKIYDLGIVVSGKALGTKLFYTGEVIDMVTPLCDDKLSPLAIIACGPCTILFIDTCHIYSNCACMCPSHRIFLTNIIQILSSNLFLERSCH